MTATSKNDPEVQIVLKIKLIVLCCTSKSSIILADSGCSLQFGEVSGGLFSLIFWNCYQRFCLTLRRSLQKSAKTHQERQNTTENIHKGKKLTSVLLLG